MQSVLGRKGNNLNNQRLSLSAFRAQCLALAMGMEKCPSVSLIHSHVILFLMDVVILFISISQGLPSNSSRLSNHGKKRLVWTPALHDRFIEAVNMAGYENPGPKTILELMNVEGLTTEHVKSHLQKFRNNIRKAKTDEPEGISPHEASSFNESACYQNTTPPTAVTTTDTR